MSAHIIIIIIRLKRGKKEDETNPETQGLHDRSLSYL
jgi:hypothetical protein